MTSSAPSFRPSNAPLLVLIAGPYTSGTDGDPGRIAANRERLERYSLPIYQRGHLPLVSEWLVLPIVRAAGAEAHGDGDFATYQYPVAHRLIERCDAVLRIPGESRGADQDVARARELGLPVCFDVSDLPDRSRAL